MCGWIWQKRIILNMFRSQNQRKASTFDRKAYNLTVSTWGLPFKGIVHTKLEILLSFTHLLLVLNLSECPILLNTKVISKKHWKLVTSGCVSDYASQWLPVSNILQNIFFLWSTITNWNHYKTCNHWLPFIFPTNERQWFEVLNMPQNISLVFNHNQLELLQNW